MQETAKVGLRIGGGLIDLVITMLLVALAGWITGLGTTTTQASTATVNVGGWAFLGIAAVIFVLFAIMEAQFGKTPGKMMIGTSVVDANGNRPGMGIALVRNLLRFIDGIALYLVGLIIMLIDKENRRLGDMLAKTRVVTD